MGEYTGLGVELPEEDPFLSVMIGMTPHAIYRLGDVDAEKFGNETRMINDGFPNVCPIPAGHENVFITLRDINKGEEILFSYGPGEYFLRWGKYFVKNKQEIEDYMDQDFDRLFEMDELFLAQKKSGLRRLRHHLRPNKTQLITRICSLFSSSSFSSVCF